MNEHQVKEYGLRVAKAVKNSVYESIRDSGLYPSGSDMPETDIEAIVNITPHPGLTSQLEITDNWVFQFLSDVVTAAGLVSYGKRDKVLGNRIARDSYKMLSYITANKGKD